MSEQNKQNVRWRLFFQTHPGATKADCIAWIRRHSVAFRESRVIRSDFIPADMQDEFTDWLRLQCMEGLSNAESPEHQARFLQE